MTRGQLRLFIERTSGGGGSGDITGVTAGTGLDGGGSSGGVTLTLDLTEVIASDSANRLLTSDGDGTLTAEANLTYDGTTFVIGDDARVNDDLPLYFGSNSDSYIKYDESANDQMVISGSTAGLAVSGSVKFVSDYDMVPHVLIEHNIAGTNPAGQCPALEIQQNTVDQQAIRIPDAANTNQPVVYMRSTTVGVPFIKIEDDSSSTSERYCIDIHIDDGNAIQAGGLKIIDDASGAGKAIYIERNTSSSQAGSGVGQMDADDYAAGLFIDFNHYGNSTHPGDTYFAAIDVDVDGGTPQSGDTINAYGQRIRMDGNAAAAAGTANATGMSIKIADADTATHLELLSGADDDDKFTISVGTAGATTITTVDDGGDAADLTFTIDGAIKLDGDGVEIENDSDSDAAALLIDNDDVDQIALDIDAANTTANVIDISANALTTGYGIYVHDDSSAANSRGLLGLIQDNSSATGAYPIRIQADGASRAILIDHNINDSNPYSTIDIDIDRTTAATSTSTTKAIAINIDDTSASEALLTYTGVHVDMDVDTTHASSDPVLYGFYADLDADNSPESTFTYGGWLDVAGANYNTGLYIRTPGGANDKHITLGTSIDTSDTFDIAVGNGGLTTITTTDSDGAAGHIVFAPDGEVRINDDIALAFGDDSDGFIRYNSSADSFEINASAAVAGKLHLSSSLTYLGLDSTADVYLQFKGSTADGVMMWDVSEDTFVFNDDINILDDEKITFGTAYESHISYKEAHDNMLEISGSTVGTVISGSVVLEQVVSDKVGLTINCVDGATDFKLASSADSGDYFSIATTTHGATTITTVDDNAAAADLTFTLDGAFDVNANQEVAIDSTAASITVGAALADGQTLKLGKNGAVETIIAPHGTAGSELYSVTNTAGTSAAAIGLTATAGGITLTSGATTAVEAVTITASQTTKDVLQITADAVTTANVIDITADALTTGAVLNIVSDSSTTDTRSLVNIHNDNGSADNVTCLTVRNDSAMSANVPTVLIHDYGDMASDAHATLELRYEGSSGGRQATFEINQAGSVVSDNDDIGLIVATALNDADEKTTYCQIEFDITDITDGDEGGRINLGVMSGGTAGSAAMNNLLVIGNEDVANSTPCEVIVNEDGIDCNFRVESDGNANMFLVDGGDNTVAVGGIDATNHKDGFAVFNDFNGTTFESTLADGHFGSAEILRYSPGADDTLTAGQIYFLHTDGTWNSAQADAVATGASQMLCVGLGGSARTVGGLIKGFIRIPSTEILNLPGSGAVDGLPLYVSDTNAGHFDFTAPSSSDDFVRIVGYAIDDDSSDVLVYFDPDKSWVEIA